MGAVKVATCCYCGTKAALVLRGKTRHELSCGSCGAPLSRMKMLPNTGRAADAGATFAKPKIQQKPSQASQKKRLEKPKKRKYRKGLFRKIVEEIWDEIEDIFD